MKIHSDQIEIGSVLPFAKLVSRNVMSFDTEKKNTQKKIDAGRPPFNFIPLW
jgi:hypothetical protein